MFCIRYDLEFVERKKSWASNIEILLLQMTKNNHLWLFVWII